METILFLIISGLLLLFILSTPQKTKQDEQNSQLFRPSTKTPPFYNMKMELKIADNGGTRIGIDRRKFHYTAHAPEKRSGIDRRKGFDRRNLMARRRQSERRMVFKTQSLN
jgi:hypothetical protein